MKYTGDKTDVTALVKYAQDLEAQTERLRAALEELRALGTQGAPSDYKSWLTFHDRVAEIAGRALKNQQA